MADLPVRLADYLRAGAARPFAWDLCDCCSWACGWVLLSRGVDPSAQWRGRYRTARGAVLHLRRGGGLLALASAAMAAAGLAETEQPMPGDIGVVDTVNGPALALWAGRRWACKSEGGIVIADFTPLRCWSV